MKALACAVLALVLCGCASIAPDYLNLEAEHVSHPLVGWPFEPQHLSEDDVTQASVLLEWTGSHGTYLEAGIGANLQGHNGGGFYGPILTGTIRAGVKIPLHK